MARPDAPWLDAPARAALEHGLPASQLWSLLLPVAEARAGARRPAELMRQWQRDRFVAPCAVDPRALLEVDRVLFAAAAAFEAVELSPLAPLGSCVAVAPGSQHRIVSALRGTEVVSDPTNVLALECARRLRDDPAAMVRLATSQRCVRAQPPPPGPGFAAHFRLFCLASAAHERADQAFTVEALTAHALLHLAALDALESSGHAFGARIVRLAAAPKREHLMQRVRSALLAARPGLAIEHDDPPGAYYEGLRFMIDVHAADGVRLPLIDGGAFDWVRRLAGHRKLAFVASAIGSQLVAARFRRPR